MVGDIELTLSSVLVGEMKFTAGVCVPAYVHSWAPSAVYFFGVDTFVYTSVCINFSMCI